MEYKYTQQVLFVSIREVSPFQRVLCIASMDIHTSLTWQCIYSISEGVIRWRYIRNGDAHCIFSILISTEH